MAKFLKSFKTRAAIKKNATNPFTKFNNEIELIYYEKDDGTETWVDGIIKAITDFSIVAGMQLVAAYKPNNCYGGMEKRENHLTVICSNKFATMLAYTLGSLSFARKGFEKEVWVSVWKTMIDQENEAKAKVEADLHKEINSFCKDDSIMEKILEDRKSEPQNALGQFSAYSSSKFQPLTENQIEGTPIEILQNELLQHYNYNTRKENKLKDCIKDLSFSCLGGLLSIYFWE
jgi:hypothetical protein